MYMTEEKNPTIESKEEEDQNFTIRQRIVDMEVYGLGLIGGWSVKNQKLLGDFMANLMHQMVADANELQYSWQKKSALKNLDMKNHTMHDLIQVAFTAGCLRGPSNFAEWSRQSEEIGKLIGGYYKYVYPELAEDPKQQTNKNLKKRK